VPAFRDARRDREPARGRPRASAPGRFAPRPRFQAECRPSGSDPSALCESDAAVSKSLWWPRWRLRDD